jgi:hypothetical protein
MAYKVIRSDREENNQLIAHHDCPREEWGPNQGSSRGNKIAEKYLRESSKEEQIARDDEGHDGVGVEMR